nr:AraC family transcriptional regulator [Agrococcus sp. ARC_14]
MLGETQPLRVAAGRVRVGERAVLVPAFDELEDWVQGLVDSEALRIDDDIRAALSDGVRVGASGRTWQRRFRSSVGLTGKQVEQVRRAEQAYALLQAGSTPAEAAAACGFADQSHLTRSLRLIRGRTPASILAAARVRPARD